MLWEIRRAPRDAKISVLRFLLLLLLLPIFVTNFNQYAPIFRLLFILFIAQYNEVFLYSVLVCVTRGRPTSVGCSIILCTYIDCMAYKNLLQQKSSPPPSLWWLSLVLLSHLVFFFSFLLRNNNGNRSGIVSLRSCRHMFKHNVWLLLAR